MRGIAGIIRFDQAPVPRPEIEALVDAMALAAPDLRRTWAGDSAGFAYLTTFLFPEDRHDAQPLVSDDGQRVLVADALLENRDALAAEFGWRPHEGAARADSESVRAAFEKWGAGCVSHLEGSFALAAWDPRPRRLFAAVDPFGFRPFYFGQAGGVFVFATTLRAVLARPGISGALNERVLARHAAGMRVDSAETLYRDVRQIPAGHQLEADAAGVRLTRYWTPDATRELHLNSDADYLAAFAHEFENAVRAPLRRTGGGVGVRVSGGLDSSAVAAVAGQLLAAGGRRLQAFHTLPQANARYAAMRHELDESRYVRALQAHAPHIDFHFCPPRARLLPLDDWDAWFDENQVPFHGLPGVADAPEQPDVELMLDGLGGNFLVSLESIPTGYLTHLFASGQWRRWWTEARATRRVHGHTWRQLGRHTVLNPLKRALRPASGAAANLARLSLLRPEIRRRAGIENDFAAQLRTRSRLPRDFRGLLHREMIATMSQTAGLRPSVIGRIASGRRAASPMFNRRLNEFCLALPFAQQIRGGWDRRLLREATRGLLPDEIRLRVTRGFPQPEFQTWFARLEPELRREMERLRTSPLAREWIDFDWVHRRWETRAARITWAEELLLAEAVALGRFLEWAERRPGVPRAPAAS